ncbi:hypothetical protein [Saccharothrix luteola]|uniref:hypothetical protein n=1 Tax=Saccharothrix luteola TaxID=2893018 RepID=UPI001E44A3D3|nr:hypothetical protein [Saccharothrix luteola]MCC8245491.1 hypothetical protein [Saccharothrix luteola]
MRFTRRTLRQGMAAAWIALTMAASLITSPVAGAAGDVERASASTQSVGASGIIAVTPVPANGRVSCYGYYGTFLVGSDVIVVDWVTSNNNECFGIATDRTIWHAWQGSGGWKRLPGNGHADDTWGIEEVFSSDPADTRRTIKVVIYGAARPYWCQTYTPATDWTGIWYACNP